MMFEKVNYSLQGKKNKTINKEFVKICKMTQPQLKKFLDKELQKYYKNVISQNGFLYVKGKDKVCLTAHMDTVHKEPVKDFYELKKDGKHIISSPQGIGGDDRCGIYMILQVLKRTNLRPTIVFCEDEEIGCVGSEKFVETNFIKNLEKMYFLIELDRRGNDDAVFYYDDNKDFHDFVLETTEFFKSEGSFTDICTLSPTCKVSSVNLSCGYYNAHSVDEYVVLEEMEETINVTINLIKEGLKRKEKFEYVEYDRYAFSDYDWYDDYNYDKLLNKNAIYTAYICWDNGYGNKGEIEKEGYSVAEIFYEFFCEHPDISFSQITDYEIWDEFYRPLTSHYLSVV